MISRTTIEREASRRATLAGIPTEAVRPYVEAEVADRPFRLEYRALAYTLALADVVFVEDKSGDVLAVWTTLNVRHPFINDFLLGLDSQEEPLVSKEQRSQIEVFLMVVLGARMDLTEEERKAYQTMHHELSARLSVAIPILLSMFDA